MAANDSVLVFVRRPRIDIPPAGQIPNLEKYGDVVIAALTYQTVFVGSVWQTSYLSQQADLLDDALSGALSCDDCNEVFAQYFPPGTRISATRQDKRVSLDWVWPEIVYRNDLTKMAQKALDEGLLPTSGLDSFVVALVLPPDTILSRDVEPKTIPGLNSMEGLGAYHGQLTLDQGGTPLSMYFCVTVWNDGSDGTAVPADGSRPAWAPWENACAALYHELGEVRLCPNIDNAPAVADRCPPPQPGDPGIPDLGLGWLVWYQSDDQDEGSWQEAGDLAVLWAGALPQRVFCKGTDGLTGVPIQALWSNALRKPLIPQGFTPQHP